ncbi:hypothetical protein GALL_519820 [mine drainage metagenome]|uniref:Uncharacterized protein n=1 Tax=mine drainage metagenome TaxID=410659 RepID=A0A1J5PSA1_9ZZZZ
MKPEFSTPGATSAAKPVSFTVICPAFTTMAPEFAGLVNL